MNDDASLHYKLQNDFNECFQGLVEIPCTNSSSSSSFSSEPDFSVPLIEVELNFEDSLSKEEDLEGALETEFDLPLDFNLCPLKK